MLVFIKGMVKNQLLKYYDGVITNDKVQYAVACNLFEPVVYQQVADLAIVLRHETSI